MLKYGALHLDIPKDPCGLKVLVQNNALEAHLVLILRVFAVVLALISSDQVEKYDTQIVTDVFMLLISHNLVETGEPGILVTDEPVQITHELLQSYLVRDVVLFEEVLCLELQPLFQLFSPFLILVLFYLGEE